MTEIKQFEIGPIKEDWPKKEVRGDCKECGGDCGDFCGTHPAGCVYGGFTEQTSYWIYALDCDRFHGENQESPPDSKPA